MMYLRVSKYLDVPTHPRRLISASAFPLHITHRSSMVRFALQSMFSGFELPNQYDSRKSIKLWAKKFWDSSILSWRLIMK